MKRSIRFLMLTCVVLCGFLLATKNLTFAQDPLQWYQKGNIAFQEQNFQQAIENYNKVLASGKRSAELHYNLGNAYFRTGKNAQAILHYEKALKINPDDEDTKFNLRIANQRTVDKIDAIPVIFYKRWARAFTAMFSTETWYKVLVGLIWLFFAAALFYRFSGSGTLKRTGFALMLLFFFFILINIWAARSSYYFQEFEKHAIVMSPSAYVKSSPDDKGNDLFIIHDGTKVEILDELNNWNKIKLANGNLGWLKKEEIEFI